MMLELLALLQECLFFLGYITGKSQFPKPFTREEEAEAIRRMAAGSEEARKELITHNLRLVSHIARKYMVPGYGPDDLISIGVIGLIKAINSYKPESGTALGTYAARCIENAMLSPVAFCTGAPEEDQTAMPTGHGRFNGELTDTSAPAADKRRSFFLLFPEAPDSLLHGMGKMPLLALANACPVERYHVLLFSRGDSGALTAAITASSSAIFCPAGQFNPCR